MVLQLRIEVDKLDKKLRVTENVVETKVCECVFMLFVVVFR